MNVENFRIVIADDHVIFRQGMKHLIAKAPDLEFRGEAGNGADLFDILKTEKTDLVVLDISMPGLGGIDILQIIKKDFPRIKVLILTMHKQREYMFHAISMGADGYLLKEDSDEELFAAIETIRNGGVFITPHLQQETPVYRNKAQYRKKIKSDKRLTQREKEVLKMVAEGIQSRKIANILNISIRTVENHRANIMRKLGFKTLVDLVRYAIQMGITELPV